MPDFQEHPRFSNSEINIRTTINIEVPGSPSFCNVILNEELPGTPVFIINNADFLIIQQ
jgi:hypothetical protein